MSGGIPKGFCQTDYNYIRDYDPAMGHQVQFDPIGFNGGLNTYAYVEGSPLRYSDPTGLDVALPMPGAGAMAGKGLGALIGGLISGAGTLVTGFWPQEMGDGTLHAEFPPGFGLEMLAQQSGERKMDVVPLKERDAFIRASSKMTQ